MSRLIDANKLYEEMGNLLMKHPSFTMEQGFMILGLINRQPIAFDPEAVVRELEKAMAIYKTREKTCHVVNCGNYAKVHYHGIQQGIKFAIEIVERGGRNE